MNARMSTKKALSLLLAFVMVLSSLGTGAFGTTKVKADDETFAVSYLFFDDFNEDSIKYNRSGTPQSYDFAENGHSINGLYYTGFNTFGRFGYQASEGVDNSGSLKSSYGYWPGDTNMGGGPYYTYINLAIGKTIDNAKYRTVGAKDTVERELYFSFDYKNVTSEAADSEVPIGESAVAKVFGYGADESGARVPFVSVDVRYSDETGGILVSDLSVSAYDENGLPTGVMTSLGSVNSTTAYMSRAYSNAWHNMKIHVKLNTPGASDGEYHLYIDGVEQASATGLDWTGTYDAYGINDFAIHNTNNCVGLPGGTEYRIYDNLGVSRVANPVAVSNGNASLTEINFSRGKRTPDAFDPDVLNYALVVEPDVRSLTLAPVAANADSTIYVDGKAYADGADIFVELPDAAKTVTLKSVAPDGKTEKTYTISINRKSPYVVTEQPTDAWIYYDDFEENKMSNYFEYTERSTTYRNAGDGLGGGTALRGDFKESGTSAQDTGGIKVTFGRTPNDGSFKPVGAYGEDLREVYVRYYVRTDENWIPSGGNEKMTRIVSLHNGWAYSTMAHIWSGDNADTVRRLLIDPVSGIDIKGGKAKKNTTQSGTKLITSSYNDWDGMDWLGSKATDMTIFDENHVGEWYCVEVHVKLNDPDVKNGEFNLWIDGSLQASRKDLDWTGTYEIGPGKGFGINYFAIENYNNMGSRQDQSKYYDNLVISREPIGPATFMDYAEASKVELSAALKAAVGANRDNPVYALNKADYSKLSWDAYVQAIQDAIVVEKNLNATEAEIDTALAAIAAAEKALVQLGVAKESPTDDWLFWDDFETEKQYSSIAGRSDFFRADGIGLFGSAALKRVYSPGAWEAIYRTEFAPQDEVYVRFYIKHEEGWSGGGWGWVGRFGGATRVVEVTPDGKLEVRDAGSSKTAVFADENVGKWYCVEIRLQTNSVGQKNGECDIWIDGTLELSKTNLDFGGAKFSNFELNAYCGDHEKLTQEMYRYYDNLVISTQPIGLVGIERVPEADKADLTAALDEAIGANRANPSYTVNENLYTLKSWKAFAQAIEAALAIEAQADASAEDVADAVAAIAAAKAALVEGAVRAKETPTDDWILWDDFETAKQSYVDGGANMYRADGIGLYDSMALKRVYKPGVEGASYSYDFAGQDEIYVRFYIKQEEGWTGGAWGWVARVNGAGRIIEATGDDRLEVRDAASSTTPIFSDANVGKWYCVEIHMKTNDTGLKNGLCDIWIDGNLEFSKTGLDYGAGKFTGFSFNTYCGANGSLPREQYRYYDNLVISTKYIGLVGLERVPEVSKDALTTVLDAAIGADRGNAAYALNSASYTATSWNAYATAVEAALAVEADEDATKDAVDEAIANIAAAKSGLALLSIRVSEKPTADWLFWDDFEQDQLDQYFEYNNPNLFYRSTGVGLGNSIGMKADYAKGATEAGNLMLGFGRTEDPYEAPVAAFGEDLSEVYTRFYVKYDEDWEGGGGAKMSRITSLHPEWSQSFIGHVWSDGPDNRYLALDPASGIDVVYQRGESMYNTGGDNKSLVTNGYNDFGNLKWLGAQDSTIPMFGAEDVGQWYAVEYRVKMNTPGKSDGIFQLWVNDELAADIQNLNWIGEYDVTADDAFGINALFLENYWNDGSPKAQSRYFDNLVVSRSKIGMAEVEYLAENAGANDKAELAAVVGLAGAAVNGTSIAWTLPADKETANLTATASAGATVTYWADAACTANEITGRSITQYALADGLNTVYIKVVSEDGGASGIYTVSITKEASDEPEEPVKSDDALVSSIALSGAAISAVANNKGTITASVANAVATANLTVTASEGAAVSYWSDAACASNALTGGVVTAFALAEGANTAYIKVVSESGTVINIYTVTITRAKAVVEGAVNIAVSAVPKAELGDRLVYTISAANMENIGLMEITFEVDSRMLESYANDFALLNGASAFLGQSVTWKAVDGSPSNWEGTIRFMFLNGKTSAEAIDILQIFADAKAEGEATLTITSVKAWAGLSLTETGEVACSIDPAAATITITKYSPLDTNKDGIINENDLVFAILYYQESAAKDGFPESANWQIAKRADVNNDGVVNLEDIMILYNEVYK